MLAFLIGATGCGGDGQATSRTSTTSAATAGQEHPGENEPANPAVRYFHDQLVINGEDVQSDFGGSLLALGMNPRDLQQDTPEHAYQTVLQKVVDVKDDVLRRSMMRIFFDTDNPR